jgi:hypothetical protein
VKTFFSFVLSQLNLLSLMFKTYKNKIFFKSAQSKNFIKQQANENDYSLETEELDCNRRNTFGQ